MEANVLSSRIKDLQGRTDVLRGYLDYGLKKDRLAEVELELSDSALWDDPEKAQELGRERAALEAVVSVIDLLLTSLKDLNDIVELGLEESDDSLLSDATEEIKDLSRKLDSLEFQRMFSGQMDPNSAYMEIQSGSGGTEAQDWAEMLLRMYLRWGERHGFKTEIMELSEGEVAGIKSATIRFDGDYAFGWLRTETGVHRLVRKSPFDSGNRRHTSFAAVFLAPEIDDDIEINLDMSDVRVDTYRASGAGGQHVNKTDSAIRLTHKPTGIVVQCQNQRSQHQNKDQAIKQLRARLFEMEELARREELREIEENKSDVSWGSQIRSYVLDSGRIKDLRTNLETGNTQAVLDGDLDLFIEESLKQGL
ncbi:MAG: peptide chain release factor 2 [Candidatus Azotimanducaceae bacterium]|uniref:Peptide chain release factor 2 n=1 Tax=OM182 bacterium TaxID=2510334 RepID=A0A520S1H8_9GAMM|nr:peptide chain release factor 2 [Gammaproteobacteria bacterium]RZO76325.1 MAG: peptide chain release factor 2 [OM182 bacterium]